MAIAYQTPLRIILTGATGMVGEGVLHEALSHSGIQEVLVINRHPCGVSHPKLKEIIHQNFMDFSPIEDRLSGYDGCLFCLGVSSVGMKEDRYYSLTHELTLHVAGTLAPRNPHMTFCYISGAGTDQSERGKLMWARVKGKTENDLLKLPFRAVYLFRPGILQPTPGLHHTLKVYHYLGWMIPLIRWIAPKTVCTLSELGRAMIQATRIGYSSKVLEVRDILELAHTEESVEPQGGV